MLGIPAVLSIASQVAATPVGIPQMLTAALAFGTLGTSPVSTSFLGSKTSSCILDGRKRNCDALATCEFKSGFYHRGAQTCVSKIIKGSSFVSGTEELVISDVKELPKDQCAPLAKRIFGATVDGAKKAALKTAVCLSSPVLVLIGSAAASISVAEDFDFQQSGIGMRTLIGTNALC
jgi:hypothetical protein